MTINIQLINSQNLDQFLSAELQTLLNFVGKYKQTCFLPEKQTLLVGTTFELKSKTNDPFFAVNYFEQGVAVSKALGEIEVKDIKIETFEELKKNDNLFQFLLGIRQASWKFDKYRTKAKKSREYEVELGFEIENQAEILEKVRIFNTSINFARGLMEDTPESINPQSIQAIIKNRLEGRKNLELKIIDKQGLEKLGMGAVLDVGRGSKFEPCLVHGILKPTGKPAGEIKNKICLVGKGLTYDTGGLDIKVGGNMAEMKFDMSGGATMLGVFDILSQIELVNTEVHFISAFVENATDAGSYRSDDVVQTYSGLTMEIANTDAEGRVTLADTLAYATMQNPDYIVEASTLTGAVIMALAEGNVGIMSNDRSLENQIYQSFENQLEPAQTLRLPEVFRITNHKRTEIADISNLSTMGRTAGHLSAGLILTTFVDQNNWTSEARKQEIKDAGREPKAYPFVHLDIAGSCNNNKNNLLEVNGSTGHGIRSLVAWVLGVDGK